MQIGRFLICGYCMQCIYIDSVSILFLNTNFSIPYLFAEGWHATDTKAQTHKKKSRAERSGDMGGHSVSSWPTIHFPVIISFNHWLIIRQNIEFPILIKPDTWQYCWVGLHIAASFRIYSRMRKDGPSNVFLPVPLQTIFFALFWLHPIHWGCYLSIITAVMATYHSTWIKKDLVIMQLCRISEKKGEMLPQCYSTTNLSCSFTVIPVIVVPLSLQHLKSAGYFM